MEESNPAPFASAQADQSTKRPLFIAIVLGAIVLAAAALAAYFFISKDGLTAPRFVFMQVDEMFGERAYVLSEGSLVAPATGISGLVLEYAESSGKAIALVRTVTPISPEDTATNPFKTTLYLLGDEPRALSAADTILSGIALSDDGTYAAYAYLDVAENPAAVVAPSASDWNVRIVSTETGEAREAGDGTMPQFVMVGDREVLVFGSTNGLTVYDLEEGSSVTDTSVFPAEVALRIRVAEDGRHLLYRDITNDRFSVFEIVSLHPTLRVEPIGQISTALVDAVIVGDRVFGIARDAEGAHEVRSFAIAALEGDGALVERLPLGAAPHRLIPQQ